MKYFWETVCMHLWPHCLSQRKAQPRKNALHQKHQKHQKQKSCSLGISGHILGTNTREIGVKSMCTEQSGSNQSNATSLDLLGGSRIALRVTGKDKPDRLQYAFPAVCYHRVLFNKSFFLGIVFNGISQH